MIEISTKEWKMVGLLSFIVVIITFLPTFIGLIATPRDSIFLGTQSINAGDTPVYYSWIEQAKEGHFLFKSLYTADEPRFIFDPFWLSVGLLAKTFSLTSFASYQLARIFLIPVFLALAYIFISYFFEEEKKRKISFFFLIFASGLGWLASALPIPPMDIWVPEATTFYTLYHSPHFIASLSSILLIFLLILRAFETKKIFYSILAGAVALIFFLFHPYYVPTIFLVIGVYIIIQSLRSSQIKWSLIKHYLTLILISSPAILYQIWTVNTFWSRQTHALQNNLPIPSSYNLLLTYGFLLILSLCGIIHIFQNKLRSDKNIFLLAWWGTQWFLPFLPFLNYQRKMLEGFHIVMVILAIFGLFYLEKLLRSKKKLQIYLLKNKSALTILFVLLFTLSNFYILLRDLNFYTSRHPLAYLKKEKSAAMLWLKKNTPESSFIFATYTNGNLIPAFAVRRTYVGYWGISATPQAKINETKQFFDNFGDKARAAFLKINKINYLFYGPEERQFQNFNPETANYLEKVYQNNEVAIYRVKNN